MSGGYDGSIKFDTKIDDGSLKTALAGLKNTLASAGKTFDTLGDAGKKAFAELSVEFGKIDAKASVLGDALGGVAEKKKYLQQQISALIDQGLKPEDAQLRALQSVYKSLENAEAAYISHSKKTRNSFAELRDVMQGPIAAAKEIIGYAKKLADAAADLYMEFGKDEKAINLLTYAAQENPLFGKAAVDNVVELSEKLSELTGIAKSEYVALATNLVAMGRTEQEVLNILQVSADRYAATGVSINTTGLQLNKTYSGLSGELGEANGKVRDLTEEELKQGKAVKVLSEQYKGFADESAKSALGAVDQLKTVFGEIRIEIGKLIAEYAKPVILKVKVLLDDKSNELKADDLLKTNRELIDRFIKGINSGAAFSSVIDKFTDDEVKKLEDVYKKLIEVTEGEDLKSAYRTLAGQLHSEVFERGIGKGGVKTNDELNADEVKKRKDLTSEYGSKIYSINRSLESEYISEEKANEERKKAAQEYLDKLIALAKEFGVTRKESATLFTEIDRMRELLSDEEGPPDAWTRNGRDTYQQQMERYAQSTEAYKKQLEEKAKADKAANLEWAMEGKALLQAELDRNAEIAKTSEEAQEKIARDKRTAARKIAAEDFYENQKLLAQREASEAGLEALEKEKIKLYEDEAEAIEKLAEAMREASEARQKLAEGKTDSDIDQFFDDIKNDAEDWSDVLATMKSAVSDSLVSAFQEIGKELVSQEGSWDSWGAVALRALGQVLWALGAQLAAMALVQLMAGNWIGAAALGVGAIAAGVAAGAAEEGANQLANLADSEAEVKKELEKFTDALTKSNKALKENKELFSKAENAANAYSAELSGVVDEASSFYESLQDMGGDISSMLIDSLVDGLDGEDFNYALEQYITEAVIKAAVFTDSFMAEASAIGQALATGIANGTLTEDQIQALNIRLGNLYSGAQAAADAASALVENAFASYDAGTLSVPGDQLANIHSGEMILPPGIAAEARSMGISIGPSAGIDVGVSSRALSANLVANIRATIEADGREIGRVAFQYFDTFAGDAYGA